LVRHRFWEIAAATIEEKLRLFPKDGKEDAYTMQLFFLV
jgi:hypothetical protein